jgi:hypothetical protein
MQTSERHKLKSQHSNNKRHRYNRTAQYISKRCRYNRTAQCITDLLKNIFKDSVCNKEWGESKASVSSSSSISKCSCYDDGDDDVYSEYYSGKGYVIRSEGRVRHPSLPPLQSLDVPI